MAQSLKTYLSNRTDVQGARRKLLDLSAALNTAKKQWESTARTASNYQDVLTAYQNAQKEYATAEREKNLAESNARVDYDAITSKKDVKNQTVKDAEINKQIAAAKEEEAKYVEAGLAVPESVKSNVANLESQLTGAPKGKVTTTTSTTTVTGATQPPASGNVSLDVFLKNLNGAGAQKIDEIRGYLGLKLNGQVDYDLISAAENVEKRLQQEEAIKGPIDRTEYYALYKKSGGGAGGAGTPQVFISSPTEAAGYINSAFRSLLGRYATADEIKELQPILNAAEKKNPSRTVNGVSTGGLNRDQFLLDIITKKPEYVQKKESAQGLTRQALATTAKANGLDLDKNFAGQVDTWVKRVENGEDVDIFKNLIRQTAKMGLPEKVGKLLDEGVDLESVYTPYRNAMAATLEISPETINLNDKTLRSAVGPDKEMSIYEFQRSLRKDPRWEYTDNAREEAYAAVNKILQDFGFRG